MRLSNMDILVHLFSEKHSKRTRRHMLKALYFFSFELIVSAEHARLR
jgi:hypothetical protein